MRAWGEKHGVSTVTSIRSTAGGEGSYEIRYILLLVFIWFQVQHPLQGCIDVFDAEQDQGIEHWTDEGKGCNYGCLLFIQIVSQHPTFNTQNKNRNTSAN